jgi:hypothetical protein
MVNSAMNEVIKVAQVAIHLQVNDGCYTGMVIWVISVLNLRLNEGY